VPGRSKFAIVHSVAEGIIGGGLFKCRERKQGKKPMR
jgi:hypothetical protein